MEKERSGQGLHHLDVAYYIFSWRTVPCCFFFHLLLYFVSQHRSTLPSLLLCCTTSFVEMIKWVIYFSSYTCNITLYVSATALFHNGTTCICLIQQLPGAWAMIDGQVSFKNYCCYMYTTVLLTILEIHQQIRLLYCWLCELEYYSRLLKK